MGNIILTVVSYLVFNLAIWLSIGKGGIIAIALANIAGATIMATHYHQQIISQGTRANLRVSLIGAIGILLIVLGLRGAHNSLPVSLSMEAVYNGFAIFSWPLFVILHLRWTNSFTETPNRFDLLCHFGMAALVTIRFATYGDFQVDVSVFFWIIVAIAGYASFNVSIKLAKGHRLTNVWMNLIGGGLLILLAVIDWDRENMRINYFRYASGFALGATAVFGIVYNLGASYTHFGKLNKASLVPPLVYDGILVASPLVMIITGEFHLISFWTISIACGMLLITVFRYRHHMRN